MPVMNELLESVRAQCAVQFDFSVEGISFKRMFSRDMLPLPDVNREIGRQLNGLTQPYSSARATHALAGRPVPEAELQLEGGLIRLAELLADGRLLLLDLSGNGALDALSAERVHVVTGVMSLGDPELLDVTAMLVRPDGYVHWATEAASPLEEARNALGDWLQL
jgi:hypothetical protein